MSANHKIKKVRANFKKRGNVAFENARKGILIKYKDGTQISQTLQYFAEVTLTGALPVFPAMINLSCEAAGGNPDEVASVAEAIVLITAAADLHDDVIDKSINKRQKQTVLGKFGATVSILAGDVLLADGLRKLSISASKFTNQQLNEIMVLTSNAIFEICHAEALEYELHSKLVVSPQDYYRVIELKSVVPELTMKIGAILANGSQQVVRDLGEFGRSYGVITAIIEEFADLLEIDELQNRLENECLPLPLLYALENPESGQALRQLLKSNSLDENTHELIVEKVFSSKEVNALQKSLTEKIEKTVKELPGLNEKIRRELEDMLLVHLECLK